MTVEVRAHAFVVDLEAPELSAGDRHHLERVLRLRPGDHMTVSDGAGSWRLCRFGAGLEPAGEVVHDAAPAPEITVGMALTKGQRPEWAVQKLTEVGADHIVLFAAARSVVRWDDDRAVGHLRRMRRVAKEAAMQSRRTRLPDIAGVVSFAVAAGLGAATLAERGGQPPSLDHPVVLVGPEGGWEADEVATGLPLTSLGVNVLRAETAAVAAGAILCALRAGVVAPAPLASA